MMLLYLQVEGSRLGAEKKAPGASAAEPWTWAQEGEVGANTGAEGLGSDQQK